jgi:hypothetical protein
MADQKSTVIFCSCGCGTTLTPFDDKGRGRRFVHGHHWRGKGRPRQESIKSYRSGPDGKRHHVVVAEKALGKPLPKGAEVHHVDGVKWNNAPSNLVLCQSHAYHLLLHARARVVKAGGNPNTQRLCCHCKQLWVIENLLSTRRNQCPRCSSSRQRAARARKPRIERQRVSGEAHPWAKLTDAIVRDIRTRSFQRGDLVRLAREIGVTPDALYQVRRGKNWKHV